MDGPVSFRDVGEALGLWLTDPPIPEGRLFRGGRIEFGMDSTHLGGCRTVINLRRGPDPELEGVDVIHVPAENTVENYDTTDRRVRRWLDRGLVALSRVDRWPLYVHCTSGRDRTGVYVAAVLRCLGVADDAIVGEYELSAGADLVRFRTALDNLGDLSWSSVSTEALRRALQGT